MNFDDLLSLEIQDKSILTADDFIKDPYWNNKLYTAGSRYMAVTYPNIIQINEFTDWDFYVQFEPEVIDELDKLVQTGTLYRAMHYEDAPLQYPVDDLTHCIYLGNSLQIVVRTNAEKCRRVWQRMDPLFYRDFIWKSGPNSPNRDTIMRIMNQLYRMV